MTQLNPSLFEKAKSYLVESQRDLLADVEIVLARLISINHISDYSFIVAPAAKTYEGYLKDFFLHIGIIDQFNYDSDRFRVGKTLNPSLRYKRFSIYQKLADLSQDGEEIAETLWNAWKYGRNEIFHYFPKDLKNLSRNEAEDRIRLILEAIIRAGEFCDQINPKNL